MDMAVVDLVQRHVGVALVLINDCRVALRYLLPETFFVICYKSPLFVCYPLATTPPRELHSLGSEPGTTWYWYPIFDSGK